jgi:hypothetical protein
MLLRFLLVPRIVPNTKSCGWSNRDEARCSFNPSRSIGETSTTPSPASVFASLMRSLPEARSTSAHRSPYSSPTRSPAKIIVASSARCVAAAARSVCTSCSPSQVRRGLPAFSLRRRPRATFVRATGYNRLRPGITGWSRIPSIREPAVTGSRPAQPVRKMCGQSDAFLDNATTFQCRWADPGAGRPPVYRARVCPAHRCDRRPARCRSGRAGFEGDEERAARSLGCTRSPRTSASKEDGWICD